MFSGDSEYQAVIDNINRVQNHGLKHKLSIPQMVIIGDQSSGKSSVLEAITKLSFPRDKDMCTRFAIQVNLRRNPALEEDVLSARIEGEKDFNNKFKVVKSTTSFEGVVEQAVKVLCKDRNIDISDKVLELTLSGPTQSPLTIIDLPGFIITVSDKQPKDLPNIISAINMDYIEDPRTIILAIVQATVDLNTTRALSEAGKVDPDGVRTIPIVTKPDYIQNGLHPDWIEILLNRKKTMKHGYLVMRNTGFDQMSLTWDEARLEEEKFFESSLWNPVGSDRMGRVAVKKFLSNVLYEHISRELPVLKREVDAALDNFRRDLSEMGTPIASTDEAREMLIQATIDLQPEVNSFLSAGYDYTYIAIFKEKPIPRSGLDPYFVRSSLHRLYNEYRVAMSNKDSSLSAIEIVDLIARYKGNNLPGFVSFTTFTNIINGHFLAGWKSTTKAHVETMHKHLSDALSNYISHAANGIARDVFTHVFDRFYRKQVLEIERTIQDIFEDESTPFTLSPHYMEAIHEERSKAAQLRSLPQETTVINPNKGKGISPPLSAPATPPPMRNESPDSAIPRPPQTTRPISPSTRHELNSEWDDEHMTEEMVTCLRAYLKTARERIVDKVIMETIERHMIKRIHIYYSMLLKATKGELTCMIESPMLKRRRQDLKTKIADFESILEEL
ncbi:hypothetical protein BGZ97_012258 [Linnemannia gamsii]|uniref:P-loop containing nucleoside triphosphate hydrolase protein n=1 Tax=Linnemannia gamsii TaxID=64522 RepID=A0A9P6R4F3_9FUNG|nr:hypothetical protein BGZ97_012258 [Linnemannia gamsii]